MTSKIYGASAGLRLVGILNAEPFKQVTAHRGDITWYIHIIKIKPVRYVLHAGSLVHALRALWVVRSQYMYLA